MQSHYLSRSFLPTSAVIYHVSPPHPSPIPSLIPRSETQGGDNPQISTGEGPERATLQQVIRTLLEDQTSWISSEDGSGWVRPAFTPALSIEHQTRWKTTGTFILLHLLTLGNGPEPISPFLLYLLLAAASLDGKRRLRSKDVLIGLGSLYQLDSGSADMLRPWMVLQEMDKLSGAGGQVPPPLMLVQNILNRCEYQVRILRLLLDSPHKPLGYS